MRGACTCTATTVWVVGMVAMVVGAVLVTMQPRDGAAVRAGAVAGVGIAMLAAAFWCLSELQTAL